MLWLQFMYDYLHVLELHKDESASLTSHKKLRWSEELRAVK